MRIITLLIIGCIVLSAGCAGPVGSASPYDIADPRWQAWDQWRQTLIADAMAEFQPHLDKANERLRELDSTIYVDVQEYERVVFFKPKPNDPGPGEGGVYRVEKPEEQVIYRLEMADFRGDPPVLRETPEGTIRSDEWTDCFALAQEFSRRAEVTPVGLTKVDLGSSEPFEVTIEVKVVGTRRHAIAGTPQPLPKPPEGHTHWYSFGVGPGPGGRGGKAVMPFPFVLSRAPGGPHQPGVDELADQAVAMLGEAELTPVDMSAKVVIRYGLQEGKWLVEPTLWARAPELGAAELDWHTGVDREGIVYAPR